MVDIDPTAFAKAFAEGFAAAAAASKDKAPSLQDLATAVRDNPHLDADDIIKRWESLQPDPKGSTEGTGQEADKGQAKTSVEDLFRKATEQSEGSTAAKSNGKADLMADKGKRVEALASMFS